MHYRPRFRPETTRILQQEPPPRPACQSPVLVPTLGPAPGSYGSPAKLIGLRRCLSPLATERVSCGRGVRPPFGEAQGPPTAPLTGWPGGPSEGGPAPSGNRSSADKWASS